MTPTLNILDDLDVEGRTVLVRVDFNVPLADGKVADDTRIRAALPSITWLHERGAKVVLASHLGRPKGKPVESMSLLPAAAHLATLMNAPVVFSHDVSGDEVAALVREQSQTAIIVLENLRFDPLEKAGDDDLAKSLAQLADLFVCDAFGTMHREHASITGIPKHLPSAAGRLVEAEVNALRKLTNTPSRPFGAVLGGAKVSDKLGLLQDLATRVDHIFIGGAMAYTFMLARGEEVGASRVEEDQLDAAAAILEDAKSRGCAIHLPTDHVVAETFSKDAAPRVVEAIEDGWMGLDVGPQTLEAWSSVLAECKTIFWNGPMGVFEWPSFSGGTKGVAEALATSKAYTVIGGGDSAAAANTFDVADRISHLSTGGGASLQFLKNGTLPGLEVLQKAR